MHDENMHYQICVFQKSPEPQLQLEKSSVIV